MFSQPERYGWAVPLANAVAQFAVVWVWMGPPPLPAPAAASRIGAANGS